MTGPGPPVEYLTLEDLLGLVSRLGAGPVRDQGLLDSACHRPRAGLFGHEAYPTLAAKAGALRVTMLVAAGQLDVAGIGKRLRRVPAAG
ncbi:MAG TPA: hypothetical protein VMI33_02545 [Streptosporangiaceae bacterium]|nr:hypothetical protein [Streptosporangiaceae bacterium]